MTQIDPSLLFKLATIRKQLSSGKRQPKMQSMGQPKRKRVGTAQGATPFAGIPDFQSYNTNQLSPQAPQNFAQGGEALAPNHRSHPFKRMSGEVQGGSGSKDDVPAMLTGGNKNKPGEFVLNQGAVLNLGLDRLNHENNRGLATLKAPVREPLNNTQDGSGSSIVSLGMGSNMSNNYKFPSPFGMPQAEKGKQDAVGAHVFDPSTGNPFQGGNPFGEGSGRHTDAPMSRQGRGSDDFYSSNMSPYFGTGSPTYSAFGPTQIPTYWNNYPGVGNVPYAVPVNAGNYNNPWGNYSGPPVDYDKFMNP